MNILFLLGVGRINRQDVTIFKIFDRVPSKTIKIIFADDKNNFCGRNNILSKFSRLYINVFKTGQIIKSNINVFKIGQIIKSNNEFGHWISGSTDWTIADKSNNPKFYYVLLYIIKSIL